MTPSLRKYHRHVWYFLAGFLPLLYVAAIAVIPGSKPDPFFYSDQPAALPEVLNSVLTESMTANLRTNPLTGERQIEIIVQKPLTVPAALVYISEKQNAGPESSILLGMLTSIGSIRFKLGENHHFSKSYVRVFDPVKNVVIQDFIL